MIGASPLPQTTIMAYPEWFRFDAELDLLLERDVDVPVERIWRAWTDPVHLLPWFCPAPWQTVACEIDLRPGGRFHTVMRSPEGQKFPSDGCYLEIVPNRRLVWTSALGPGFRPLPPPVAAPGHECAEFAFTACLSLEPVGNGARYVAIGRHADAASRKRHEDMGFHDGWGAVLDQLVDYVRTMK